MSPRAHSCAGCKLASLTPEEARRAKHDLLVEELSKWPVTTQVLDVPAIPPHERYRTRAKLMVGAGGALGLYREGTHEVEDTLDCPVLAPSIAQFGRALQVRMRRADASFGIRPSLEGGALRALDVREVLPPGSSPRLMVTLVVEREIDRPQVIAELRECAPDIAILALNFATRSPQILGPETHILWGDRSISDVLYPGAPFVLASPGSFVQAHRNVTRAIHDGIIERLRTLPRSGPILELYAGSGLLALRIARDLGAEVHAIENHAPAIARLTEAARQQGLATLTAEAADATERMSAFDPRTFSAVLVDPPRRGLTPELRIALARQAPELVSYVSCNPETLARDLAHFRRLGYGPSQVTPFDMMPLTDHVETLALLERSEPTPPTVLHRDERLLVVAKDPHEPTIPTPGQVISTLERVRRLEGAERAVPVHRLDAGTSGVCLFALAPDAVPELAKALAEGSKRYITLVRGITHGKGILRRPLRDEGKTRAATTRFTRMAILGGHSFLRVSPQEGRTHQIRRHLASIGHPILGDERYGHPSSNRHLWERWGLDRTFLHCARIELATPGGPQLFEAPLPRDLARVQEALSVR